MGVHLQWAVTVGGDGQVGVGWAAWLAVGASERISFPGPISDSRSYRLQNPGLGKQTSHRPSELDSASSSTVRAHHTSRQCARHNHTMTATRQRPLRPLSSATDLTDYTDCTHSTLEADVCGGHSPQRDSGTRS